MLIEVKETHPPRAANRSGTVVAADGHKFDCWPNMLRNIQVGKRYEIVTSTNDRGYTSIIKATPVNDAAPSPNGAAAAPTAAAPTSNGEAEFVGRVMHALILKGEVAFDNRRSLEDATQRLRAIWYNTSPELAHYRQAAE